MFKVSAGYPPPDEALRNWLVKLNVSGTEPENAAEMLHGFIRSLLLVTLDRLEKIEGSATLYSCYQDLTTLQI